MEPLLADGAEKEAHLPYPGSISYLLGSDLLLQSCCARVLQPHQLSPASVPLLTLPLPGTPPPLSCPAFERAGRGAGESLAKRFRVYLRSCGLEDSFKPPFLVTVQI